MTWFCYIFEFRTMDKISSTLKWFTRSLDVLTQGCTLFGLNLYHCYRKSNAFLMFSQPNKTNILISIGCNCVAVLTHYSFEKCQHVHVRYNLIICCGWHRTQTSTSISIYNRLVTSIKLKLLADSVENIPGETSPKGLAITNLARFNIHHVDIQYGTNCFALARV